MIRRRLHIRWLLRGGALFRQMERHHETWVDRYNARHVERYGEGGEGVPLWRRPFDRFVCWLADWQTTWRMRP